MNKIIERAPKVMASGRFINVYAENMNPTIQGMAHSVEDTVRRFVQGGPLPEVTVLPDEDPEFLNPLRAEDIVDIVDAQEAYSQAKEYIARYEEAINKMEEENKLAPEAPSKEEEHAKVSVDPQ